MNERFTTLDQVVKDICEIGGDDYDHKSYGKVLKVCVNTLRGFNLYSSTPYVKTEEFEVLPNNTVLLPKNALDVVRVGKNDRCGEIEEIFYSKDLSMDAKNIEEHCKCSGKVQVIETIETGTGETLCDYIVEGIDLGSPKVCTYTVNDIFTDYGFVSFIIPEILTGGTIYTILAIVLGTNEGNVLDFSMPPSASLTRAEILLAINSNFNNLGGAVSLNINYTTGEVLITRLVPRLTNPPNTVSTFNFQSSPWLYTNINYCTDIILKGQFIQQANNCPSANNHGYGYWFEYSNNITFEVMIDGVWSDQTIYIIDNNWELGDKGNVATLWRFKDLNGVIVNSEDVTVECEGEGLKTFEVNINGEWIDQTEFVSEEGIWVLNNTTDIVTEWRYRDSEGNPGEPTPIEGICRVDLQRQEVSKWVDNNIECDTNGRCKSCGNFVPTYTTAWYGGWYSSAPIYSRQLAQNNLNLPNSGQAYYEQYTARPYPARWGFYNLDLAKGVLRLSYNFEHGEKIVIIYSTDMVEVEGAKVVAVEWFDMLLYRCKELIWNRNSVDGTRQRQLYEREYTRIKKIYNKTTHEEWRRAIMKVKYSGVKR